MSFIRALQDRVNENTLASPYIDRRQFLDKTYVKSKLQALQDQLAAEIKPEHHAAAIKSELLATLTKVISRL